ncbi:MAG: phenylalanine--tRNA ligase subunit beta [Bryobacteraceae bacterium]
MKFSYQWLCELVPGLTVEPRDLQRLITMKTAECEGIEPTGAHFAKVVAARVLSVEPMPKGKNKLARIDTGSGKTASVVCGAPNIRPGLLTAWVPPGTGLGGETIGRATFEGVESEGMLASAAELGINRDRSGLLELEGVEPGEPLPGLRPDWIVEIDNKSLTHRPDLWGHYGMAREVAAITEGTLVDPVKEKLLPRRETAAIAVEIEDYELCPRYSALVFESATVGTSPLWLQTRLESIGLNPIDNLVDVTNYVLAELPQPMHAFDADKLVGGTIFVRRARTGESIRALNGVTYKLEPADLVIADASGPIAIAGVIGGADSAISASTTRVVLESANFQAASVRLTSSRHKLRTDASIRFEKALDPENTVRGIARAIELFREVSPGIRVAGGVADCRGPIRLIPPLALSADMVSRKLGKQVSQQTIARILTALGFGVSEIADGLLMVTVPTWRATKDISLKDDLVEEIGRMVGYKEIAPAAPVVACTVPPANPMRSYLRRVRRELAAQGFTEIYNYSFANESDAKRFSLEIGKHAAIRNPIADLNHLRASLLPGLFRNIAGNVRHFREFRIFEIGSEIHARPAPALPDEIEHAAAAIYNAHGDERDFFELKRVVECLFSGAKLAAAEARPYEHPARAAEIFWRDSTIGRIFELHPSLLQAEGIEGRAVLFDVDLRTTQQLAAARNVKYKPLRKYQTSGFDLSVVAGLRMPASEIERQLTELAGDALASIEFVRQYSGPPLPEGKKSASYHVEAGALDHTLDTEEVSAVRDRMIRGMQKRGFELRV